MSVIPHAGHLLLALATSFLSGKVEGMRKGASRGQAVVFPRALATIRDLRGISQETLSKKSGVSEGLIANLETGRRQPSRETLVSLAKETSTPVESIGLFCRTPEQADLLDELLVDALAFTRELLAAEGSAA